MTKFLVIVNYSACDKKSDFYSIAATTINEAVAKLVLSTDLTGALYIGLSQAANSATFDMLQSATFDMLQSEITIKTL